MDNCGRPLVNYRDGRFCQQHLPFEGKCGKKGCETDALDDMPACGEHRVLYRQWESRFGRDRSLHSNRRQVRRQRAIEDGEERMEWEPAPQAWDSTIEHYWQARHIKVVELAVTACGVPLTHTKFPFSEGERNITRYMNDSWPQQVDRPTYLGIDKGCKVMATLRQENNLLPPAGWLATTNIKVDPWHYNSHQIDALCITWCNPTDRQDPNLIQLPAPRNQVPGRATAQNQRGRAHARRHARDEEVYQRAFNFEAAEHLNAWLEPFSATMTKLRPDNHDLFLSIILQLRANKLIASNTAPVE